MQARLNIIKTRDIRVPTYYVEALRGEFSDFAYDEEKCEEFRGEWRTKAFQSTPESPLDLEIGTGNGYFFAQQAFCNPNRLLLGLELKFKPLIQTIRRAVRNHSKNVRVARYHAKFISHLFLPDEIENVFIHHPDPWTRRRQQKKRLMQKSFLEELFIIQKKGGFVDFKTDSPDYFFWAVEEFKKTAYIQIRYSEDLHNSEWAPENFVTHFESLFIKKGQPIFYMRAQK